MSSYARVLDDGEGVDHIATLSPPPDLLEPDDVTANGQWWDLRHHDWTLVEWEALIEPHGWLPIVTSERPPNTDTTTYDYSVELVDGGPTEVWTGRPWTPEELAGQEAMENSAQMIVESDEAVDKLVAVVEALNLITDMTNSTINANPAAIIKDVARELKTVARQANREARFTSGRTESTDTGTEVPEA